MTGEVHDERGLQALTDRCVRCGLCLTHCPTYLDSRLEGDGPRGRVVLIQALDAGELIASPRLEAHLDGCLSCRACEVACPAQVRFGEIMDRGRAILTMGRPRRARLARLATLLLRGRRRRRALALGMRIVRRLGAIRLARRGVLGPRLARAASLAANLPPAIPRLPAQAPDDDIRLFTGCVTELAEPEVLEDAVRLLTAAGYRVNAPPRQRCCGALLQHAGDLDGARRLARQNLAAFAGPGTVATVTSGCAATLRDYAWLVPGGGEFASRVHDVAWLLAQRSQRLQFAALPLRAALHRPCTLGNVPHEADALLRLLQAVPQLQLTPLGRDRLCCGAAGLAMLTAPAQADRLLASKIAAARETAVAVILSANVGCSLHLAAGLEHAGLTAAVTHPLRLLARQLLPDGRAAIPDAVTADRPAASA